MSKHTEQKAICWTCGEMHPVMVLIHASEYDADVWCCVGCQTLKQAAERALLLFRQTPWAFFHADGNPVAV